MNGRCLKTHPRVSTQPLTRASVYTASMVEHEHSWKRAYTRGPKREWIKTGWLCFCGAVKADA